MLRATIFGWTVEILFGDPFRTPTRDEYGQFMAAGAARRSAEFGRQVGAAIATEDGSIISMGTNEVPEFGGGSYWEDQGTGGNRDFEIGNQATNRKHLDDLVEQLRAQIAEVADVLLGQAQERSRDAAEILGWLRDEVVDSLAASLRAGGLKDLTEFGRAVHAEMDALLEAARRGVSVSDATLYTTTFPCHNCARHVIAAGIKRVVFIEPYAKSRAEDLHPEAIAIAQSDPGQRLAFEPFVGVAPRRYLDIFDASSRAQLGHVSRKDDEGNKQTLDKALALPVFVDAGLPQFRPKLPAYRAKELLALDHFKQLTGEGDEPDALESEPNQQTPESGETK